MSHLVVVVYSDQYRAAEIIATVQRVRQREGPDAMAALSVSRDVQGNVHLFRSPADAQRGASASDLTAAIAAPLMRSLRGQATGECGAIGIAFLHSLGVSDWFLQQLSAEFTAGNSAIIHLTRDPDTDDTLMEICKFSGIVLETALADGAEQRLCQSIAP